MFREFSGEVSVSRRVGRHLLAGAAGAVLFASLPAEAQFFMKSKDFSDVAVTGSEAGVGQVLPGATPEELRAALTWNLRAALNVAALQCQFEPTLGVVANYNAILTDHKAELKQSFDTLSNYFKRSNTTVKAGQTALDQFGTRAYSTYATVSAQYNFCQTANEIGRDAVFTPRGGLGGLALARTKELRNSLVPWGEQRFPRFDSTMSTSLPRLDAICWSKKGEWVTKKCGPINFPPATGTSYAQR
ncbi:conserved hypothetical protein [Sphingomonas sp. EC-HK361]|nr:conserved hypothetical protein [Sphingomonas sp. EC-HK361]